MALYVYTKGNVGYDKVGTPSLENGIASNFSLTDYYKLNRPFFPGKKSWKFQIKFKLDYPGSTARYALTNETLKDWRAPKLEVQTASSTQLQYKVNISTNGSSWNILGSYSTISNFDYTKWYYVKCEFTGTQYIMSYKKEGDADFTTSSTITNSTPIYQDYTCTGMSFGCDMSSGAQWVSYFPGQINLDETFIEINNEPWLGTKSFRRVKVRNWKDIEYKEVKCMPVGNPTINNGILSDFTSSDYYKLSKGFYPGTNTWEFVSKARFFSFSAKNTIISYRLSNTRNFQFGTTTTGTLNLYMSSNGSSVDLANGVLSTLTVGLNTWYWFKLRFDGTKYELLVSEDKENWTVYITVNSSTPIWGGTENSLGYNWTSYPEVLNGEIDLNETYFKIGSDYWFNGNIDSETYTLRMKEDDYKIENGQLVYANPKIYLEGTGTQYIDTGHYANGLTVVEGKFKFNEVQTLQQRVFGADEATGTTGYSMSIYINGSRRFAFTAKDGVGSWTQTNFNANTFYHTFVLGKPSTNFYIDGYQLNAISGTQNNTAEKTLYLFAINGTTGTTRISKLNICYIKIIQNDVLVKHFVPVPEGMQIGSFTVPSNGMFDIVNQQFYANQGSGTFIYGKENL